MSNVNRLQELINTCDRFFILLPNFDRIHILISVSLHLIDRCNAIKNTVVFRKVRNPSSSY